MSNASHSSEPTASEPTANAAPRPNSSDVNAPDAGFMPAAQTKSPAASSAVHAPPNARAHGARSGSKRAEQKDDRSFIQIARTPLVPERILRHYGAYCSFDGRFQAAARLLACLHLSDRNIPTAFSQAKENASGKPAYSGCYGSILSAEAANAGRAFLSSAVHRFMIESWLLCEDGACIDEERLFGNALSSSGTTGNLMAPLALDLALASRVLKHLLPAHVHTVHRIQLETSPGRRDIKYLDDRTAFDAAIYVTTPKGEPCIIYIEMKYAESLNGPVARWRPRYEEVLIEAGLHQDPESPLLRSPPLEQLTREHLLASRAVRNGVTPRAVFLAIGPALNRRVQAAFQVYQGELLPLDEDDSDRVPFTFVTLERVIETIALAGATELARDLWDRYCDFQRIYDLVLQDYSASAASESSTHEPAQESLSPPPSSFPRRPPMRRLTTSTNARRSKTTSASTLCNTAITTQGSVERNAP